MRISPWEEICSFGRRKRNQFFLSLCRGLIRSRWPTIHRSCQLANCSSHFQTTHPSHQPACRKQQLQPGDEIRITKLL
ncbi:unnamed protein product [Toxocara canis]|uniref:Uncharacterized protein n=1 Tax=Toxocara canis TaxID=6265 RepID=A0A3P7FRM0_TOXCA|nr:unnamed protein product [Toxocara canis]